MQIKVGIAGTTGYTGMELVRILSKHPNIAFTMLSSETYAGKKVKEALPYFVEEYVLEKFNVKKAAENCDVVFLCLPHTESMNVAPVLLKEGIKVIDLGGDFRIKDAAVYEKYYKAKHTAKAFLKQSVYGLTEFNREAIKKASLLANPGCYPTSVLLGAVPAVKSGIVKKEGIIVNSLSGISGAGRKAKTELQFSEAHGSVKAYKLVVHQHLPEMEQELSKACGLKSKIKLSFTPHLVPINRGILSTMIFDLKKNISTASVIAIYKKFYAGEKFVRVLDEGIYPETRYVFGTNFCDIGIKVDSRMKKLIVVSAIDNLVKGAAGQAVQNFNLMFHLPEETALVKLGVMP